MKIDFIKWLIFVFMFFIFNTFFSACAMQNKQNTIRNYNAYRLHEISIKMMQKKFSKFHFEKEIALLKCPSGNFINSWGFNNYDGYMFLAYTYRGKLVGYTLTIDEDKTSAKTFSDAMQQSGVSPSNLIEDFESPPGHVNYCVRKYHDKTGMFKEIGTTQAGDCDLTSSPVIAVNVTYSDYPDGCVFY